MASSDCMAFGVSAEMQHFSGVRLRNFVAECVVIVTRSSKLASSRASVDHKNASVLGVVSARVTLLYAGLSKPGTCPSLGVCHDLVSHLVRA